MYKENKDQETVGSDWLFHMICLRSELNISPVYVRITEYPVSSLMVGRSRLSLSANQIVQKDYTSLNTVYSFSTRNILNIHLIHSCFSPIYI